jgi:hypothetical protein
MKDRSYTISSSHQECEFCTETLFAVDGRTPQSQFYLFPCSHGFHTKCLLERAKSHLFLDASQLSAGEV